MTARAEVETIEIGKLRRSNSDIALLFEAVRVAQELGHDVAVYLTSEPIPAPEGEERDYDKRERERNSTVLIFFAETGEK